MLAEYALSYQRLQEHFYNWASIGFPRETLQPWGTGWCHELVIVDNDEVIFLSKLLWPSTRIPNLGKKKEKIISSTERTIYNCWILNRLEEETDGICGAITDALRR